jgi:hypothetical protein
VKLVNVKKTYFPPLLSGCDLEIQGETLKHGEPETCDRETCDCETRTVKLVTVKQTCFPPLLSGCDLDMQGVTPKLVTVKRVTVKPEP